MEGGEREIGREREKEKDGGGNGKGEKERARFLNLTIMEHEKRKSNRDQMETAKDGETGREIQGEDKESFGDGRIEGGRRRWRDRWS